MATLDRWLFLLGPTPRTLVFPRMELMSGRDHEPHVVHGHGEVYLRTQSSFEFRLVGQPTDAAEATHRLRQSVESPYNIFDQFRVTGSDEGGVEWQLGWTRPRSVNLKDGDWVLTGKFNSLSTDDRSSTVVDTSSVENMFETPLHHPMAQVMTQFVQSNIGRAQEEAREYSLDRLDTQLRFTYEPPSGRLSVTAPTSSAFEHPYAENWIAEPLRILFGQLIFPRLVARNFGNGRALIWVRRSPSYVSDASFGALWAADAVLEKTKAQFWDLYAGLLTFIAGARDKDGHPNFEANTLTHFYEEIVQATRGTRWVWALTLASVVEGQTKMLIAPGEKRDDVDNADIESLSD